MLLDKHCINISRRIELFIMTDSYYLPVFTKNFAEYLQDNFVGRLHTEIRTTASSISVKVHVSDPSFNDELEIGEYLSHFEGNTKVREQFKGHQILMDGIHLIYEKGERKDSHQEIPFP